MKLLSIAGFAGCGKNLFAEVLQQELLTLKQSSHIFAFADALKKDCRKEILDKYNIDILNCSRAEKDSVRHILVERAEANRAHDPDYYVKLIEKELELWDVDYAILADNRYANEAKMVQNNGGIVVYISLYTTNQEGCAIFLEPANETEAKSCAAVEKICDYNLKWIKNPENSGATNQDWVRFSVQRFIRYFQQRNFFSYPAGDNFDEV